MVSLDACVQGATFSLGACMQGATFSLGACMQGATFSLSACVQGATFSLSACVQGATWGPQEGSPEPLVCRLTIINAFLSNKCIFNVPNPCFNMYTL